MQIGYGIILEDEIYNFMREMELLLFEKFGLKKGLYQSPHITIKPPFEVDSFEPYMQYLDELCEKTSPFQIELNGFNAFAGKVIYLDVRSNNHLFLAYETIFSDLKKMGVPVLRDDMIFHATLAYGDVEAATFAKAYDYLQEHFHPHFSCQTKKIGLFYQLPEDSGWIVIKEKALKN